jgi:cytochrome c nitrite reductase small subunit
MDAVYEGWFHGGHKNWANCNDCHTPHELIPKYWVKATSGYHHVTAFSFGNIPDAIRAKEASRQVVQENCIRCHTSTVEDILVSATGPEMDNERYCFECHRSVAHGESGISILPYQHSEGD